MLFSRGATPNPTHEQDSSVAGNSGSVVTSTIIAFLVGCFLMGSSNRLLAAEEPGGIPSASSLAQKWNVSNRDKRLTASADITYSGLPGDRFVLLRAPAVLTQFNGPGLRLSKVELPNEAAKYIVTIPAQEEDTAGIAPDGVRTPKTFTATFQFQLEAISALEGIPVLTGSATLQQIELIHDEVSWEVECKSAARVESEKVDGSNG